MMQWKLALVRRLSFLLPFKGGKEQDKWVIFDVLPLKRGGYFVDLAAADGVNTSNTYALEKVFGWTGICIEANPDFVNKLEKRRSCIIEDAVVSDRIEGVRFRIDNRSLGGIVADDTDNNPRLRGDQLETATVIERKSDTLISILERHGAPGVIDYLSLDVEGSEERVIRSLDFDRYTFRCMTIERPTPRVNEILLANAYVFVKNRNFDSFYVHRSVLETCDIACEPFEQIPPKDR
ncbi:FkbM family methyltransferase [Candidatus Eisenbacteria bacterium]|uniref:FkbM family methyltransferase n=1 Tax=Eiseniibacteriota bacterium TaxID=2212470 RepID=A0ABV6YNR4_UNCEI